MSRLLKNYNRLFFVLEAAYWASYCSLYAFVVTILTEYGYDSVVCGIVTTCMALCSIFVQFLMGYVTDTFLPAKRVIVVMAGLGVVGTFFLRSAVNHSPAVMILSILGLSLLNYSLHSTIDAWAIASMRKHRELDFAIVRSGGSAGYALTASVLGILTASLGVDIVFPIHAALGILVVLCCLLIEEVPCQNRRKYNKNNQSEGLSFGAVVALLVKNKPYVQFIITMTLLQFAFRPAGTYLYLVVQYAGGTSAHMGIAILVGSGIEVLCLWYGSKLLIHGVPMSFLMAFGIMCCVLRGVTFLIPNIWVLIALQLLQAIAYGCYLQVFIRHISNITPQELNATATTIGTGIAMGFGAMLGNMLGGIMFNSLGAPITLMIFSGVGLLAFIVFAPTALHDYRDIRKKLERLRRVRAIRG